MLTPTEAGAGTVVITVAGRLVLAFGRARDAVLIMLNLPLALIGGGAGVFLSGVVVVPAMFLRYGKAR